MSSWVRVLVFAFVGGFVCIGLILTAKGDLKAAAGALILAAMLSPTLLEAWRPGRYVLRKPTDGSSDNLVTRLKQFRVDHPGIDGTIILGLFAVLAIAFLVSLLVSLLSALL